MTGRGADFVKDYSFPMVIPRSRFAEDKPVKKVREGKVQYAHFFISEREPGHRGVRARHARPAKVQA